MFFDVAKLRCGFMPLRRRLCSDLLNTAMGLQPSPGMVQNTLDCDAVVLGIANNVFGCSWNCETATGNDHDQFN